MNGDRNDQIFFFFIGYRKNNTACNLDIRGARMCQRKYHGAGGDGKKQTPFSKKPIKDTPEKQLFRNRSNQPADQKKQHGMKRFLGKVNMKNPKGIDLVLVQKEKSDTGNHPESRRPEQPFLQSGLDPVQRQSHEMEVPVNMIGSDQNENGLYDAECSQTGQTRFPG